MLLEYLAIPENFRIPRADDTVFCEKLKPRKFQLKWKICSDGYGIILKSIFSCIFLLRNSVFFLHFKEMSWKFQIFQNHFTLGNSVSSPPFTDKNLKCEITTGNLKQPKMAFIRPHA